MNCLLAQERWVSGQKAQDQLRAERLAAALRANLKKRKARSRARKEDEAPADTATPDSD